MGYIVDVAIYFFSSVLNQKIAPLSVILLEIYLPLSFIS